MYCRIYLSIHGLYSINKQSVFSVFVMSRGDTEKCYLYCPGQYRMYSLCSRIHIQYNNECCDMYCLYILCCWDLCVYCLLNYCE